MYIGVHAFESTFMDVFAEDAVPVSLARSRNRIRVEDRKKSMSRGVPRLQLTVNPIATPPLPSDFEKHLGNWTRENHYVKVTQVQATRVRPNVQEEDAIFKDRSKDCSMLCIAAQLTFM